MTSFGSSTAHRLSPAIANLPDLTITEARSGLDRGDFSASDLVEACLARIEATEGRLKAWVMVDAEGARQQAARPTEGPLAGIPFGIKDIIDVQDLPTTASSRVLAGNIAVEDAPVVATLRRAGAIILGKTNTQEFAYGCVSPPTANPFDLTRIPGGSSGGSAAAVAVSQCLGALGTDTAGSIRIPASCCGVSGLKPRPDVIPVGGVVPLAPSFDAVGPIARTPDDLLLIWDALGQSEPIDDGFRLAVPNSELLQGLDPEVEAAFNAAVSRLRSITVESGEVNMPSFYEFDVKRGPVLMIEALEVHRKAGWWPDRAADYNDETRSNLEFATKWDGTTTYVESQQACRDLAAEMASILEAFEVLATPTLKIPPPTMEEAAQTDGRTPRRPVVMELTRLTGVANVARMAAVSIPCGFTATGLPIGLQLMGPSEQRLLQVAKAYEDAAGWTARRPGLIAG